MAISNTTLRQRSTLGCAAVLTLALLSHSAASPAGKAHEATTSAAANEPVYLWQNPSDIASRNLYYGPGGKEHEPHTVYTFIKEDFSGTNPKFDVRDENGVKWRVKLGVEARPEVVATRLVWAVGYYANEDYFLPDLRVRNVPRLKRGRNFISKHGTIHNVRLKRSLKGEEKIGGWKWSDNPFTRQRELNGLRVMMALLNNWDLKDENNAIYEEKKSDSGTPELHYAVSDLGASFGTTGRSWTHSMSKGNLKAYQHSKFIRKTTSEYVDFYVPSRPALIYLATPNEFFSRVDMRWIGRHIPRSDGQWIGSLLAQLSPDQIRDAFRAAGYTPDQVNAYAAIVEKRIADLKQL
jgi:hypothetical protein